MHIHMQVHTYICVTYIHTRTPQANLNTDWLHSWCRAKQCDCPQPSAHMLKQTKEAIPYSSPPQVVHQVEVRRSSILEVWPSNVSAVLMWLPTPMQPSLPCQPDSTRNGPCLHLEWSHVYVALGTSLTGAYTYAHPTLGLSIASKDVCHPSCFWDRTSIHQRGIAVWFSQASQLVSWIPGALWYSSPGIAWATRNKSRLLLGVRPTEQAR